MHITDDRLDRAGTYLLRFDGTAWLAIALEPPSDKAEPVAVFTPVDERTVDACLTAFVMQLAGNEVAASEALRRIGSRG